MNMSISGGESVSANGITRAEAWRVFFGATRVRVNFLCIVAVAVFAAWWILKGVDRMIDNAHALLVAQPEPGLAPVLFVFLSFLAVGLCFVQGVANIALSDIVLQFSLMHGIAKRKESGKPWEYAFTEKPAKWLENPLFPKWVRHVYVAVTWGILAPLGLMVVMTVWWLVICHPEVFNFLSFL